MTSIELNEGGSLSIVYGKADVDAMGVTAPNTPVAIERDASGAITGYLTANGEFHARS